MDDAVIEVIGLRKSYGDTAALAGVELKIRPGEVFAILGPNGAGKTTTISILTGQLSYDAGTVRVLEQDPTRANAAHRARVGVVAQTGSAFDTLTVEEVVRHFALFYPCPRQTSQVLDLVGLEDKRAFRVKELSGGQQRRLDVALGIIGNPDVLFLDEPTIGFDPAARREFWQLIRELKTQGTTIVLTTHYLDEVAALADRIAVLLDGKVAHLATPAELTARCAKSSVVQWQDTDGLRSKTTATPTALVAELSQQYGGEVPGLVINPPSLEDVYLTLTQPAPMTDLVGSKI